MVSLQDLDTAERVGQLFWIGFEGTALTPALRNLIRTVRPGGVILFGRNIESARQVRALTDSLHRALRVPPFIAVDQEGGRVSRLRPIIGPTPACQTLASMPRPAEAVRRHAEGTAAALRTLGFNVNFAPVLDLSGTDPRNGIGDRAFGENPALVTSLAFVYARAHQRLGILPVGKHFPGLGGAGADTHLTLPVIRRPRTLLWGQDLLPYRSLRRLLPIVMVGHAHYPALQGTKPCPATLSAAVIGRYLRRRVGFRGLILTDDLEMGAIDQEIGGADQARAAFLAGSDGLMFCRSADRILAAREALLADLSSGRIPAARLRASLRRALALKGRWLLGRRRARYSEGSLRRARLLFEGLEAPAVAGFDPTDRP